MHTDYVAHLREALIGCECRVERIDPNWSLKFAPDIWFVVGCPWRIVTNEGIAFADEDHGQIFGSPRPIDGEALSNALLDGAKVTDVGVSLQTADVRIEFTGGLRIDLFNNSAGYEGWSVQFPSPPSSLLQLIGLGGGGLAAHAS